jgi:hypothetical protein
VKQRCNSDPLLHLGLSQIISTDVTIALTFGSGAMIKIVHVQRLVVAGGGDEVTGYVAVWKSVVVALCKSLAVGGN